MRRKWKIINFSSLDELEEFRRTPEGSKVWGSSSHLFFPDNGEVRGVCSECLVHCSESWYPLPNCASAGWEVKYRIKE